MAAYAALVSVMHIIEQIQHHPRPPISLHKDQVHSLTEKVTFLQDFLEVYSHIHNEEADRLQRRIAGAAFAAEDVIESHIADQTHDQSTSTHGEGISSTVEFYQSLQKVIQSMDLIEKEVMGIQEKMGSVQDIQLHRSSSISTAGSSSSPSKGQNIIVGLHDVLIQLMDKLTGQQSNRQIIPIVGMGGIGKTTLAKNAYENSLIVQHFDIRAWVTISQEYSRKEILLEALSCQKNQENKKILSGKNEEELGVKLHKFLYGRRYFIVMDDMWSIEAWDKIKFFFPDNNNGSRVIITTRLSNIALQLPSTYVLEKNFLDQESSWNLLCKIVFGEDGCPLELEGIGKKIAQNCKGLPLSIVVIGGLLAKSKQTGVYWKDVAENLNSIVNLEDNEHCFKLLYTSYNHLPVHLKSCFLYMGVFREDNKIRVSDLIKLWVAEGFLKPITGKSLEEVATEYLNDLVDRNLILVLERKYNGRMKFCKIHDLVRDLCLREAEKENFLCVTKRYGYDNSRFLRVLKVNTLRALKASTFDSSKDNFFQQVNLRYLLVHYSNLVHHSTHQFDLSRISSSLYLLWNLQTLIMRGSKFIFEIWKMPLLRHVELGSLFLRDPSADFSNYCLGMSDEQNDFVLENLQTLSIVVNFRCSEEMIKMIPNIKKLGISYDEEFKGSHYCLNNLACLHKLESLGLVFLSWLKPSRSDLMQNLTFPHSLKKLSLEGSNLIWEDISTKIGSLPLLQVLRLRGDSFVGPEWETVDGQFLSLKFLQIEDVNLKRWTTDNTHFPRLEHLVLKCLYELKEIPSCIGEITTLQSIELDGCSDSAVLSAKEIVEEQEQLGNESLQVRVILWDENPVLESLASHNFQVESIPSIK